MEDNPLLVREKINGTKKKIIITNQSCYVIQNILIFSIFIIQVFMTTYLILLGKYAQELDLFNFNKTETDDYITKFKIIINHVCDNLVNCNPSASNLSLIK